MSESESDLAFSLVTYNLCHSDMLVALRAGSDVEPPSGADATPPLFIARPRFNSWHPVSCKILERLREAEALGTVSYPAESDHSVACPLGFVLNEGIEFDNWGDFHMKDGQAGMPTDAELASGRLKPVVHAVYFPLIALIIPKWLGIVSNKARFQGDGCRKVLILVSGAGLPRDPTADAKNNSTEGTAQLIAFFVSNLYVDIKIETVLVHSPDVGMFRYDDNIRFVNEQLRPAIESRRTELARLFGAEWKHRFRLMNVLTSGAPARMLSIHNSLRRFQPHTLHVWQLKSFWHEYPSVAYLKDSDVEFQRFRTTELSPPLPTLTQVGEPLFHGLIANMIEHQRAFVAAVDARQHELERFWLRKTRQPVLAILVTQRDDEPPRFWRGMNVEVSMPTGSLCSERAAIAAALAQDPMLSRKHFRMIAVLAMTLPAAGASVPTIAASSASSSASTPAAADGALSQSAWSSAAAAVVAAAPRHSALSLMSALNSSSQHAPAASPLSAFASPLPVSQHELATRSFSSEMQTAPTAASSVFKYALLGAAPVAATPSVDALACCAHAPAVATVDSSPLSSTASSASTASASAVLRALDVRSSSAGPMFELITTASSSSSSALPSSSAGASASRSASQSSAPSSTATTPKTRLASPMFPLPIPNAADAGAVARLPGLDGGASASSSTPTLASASASALIASASATPPASTPTTPSRERRSTAVLPRHAAAFRALGAVKDLNPLAPCGSCKEWLKKIAECNPDFKVVTFSDPSLQHVYVDPVIDWS